MKESGFYPSGAEFDPNAPYNQKTVEPTEIQFEYTSEGVVSDELATVARVLNAMRNSNFFPCFLESGHPNEEPDDIVLGVRGLLREFLIREYIEENFKYDELEDLWVDSYRIILNEGSIEVKAEGVVIGNNLVKL